MWEWRYVKEPLDMKLLFLRFVDKIGIVIIAALVGAAIVGGSYTISKAFFSGPAEYELTQRYYIQYATDPRDGLSYTYINYASWDMWMKSDWFVERIWDYTVNGGLNPEQYGYVKTDLPQFISGNLETDLRVAVGTIKTPYPALTEKLSESLTKTMMDFRDAQIEIMEIRVIDTIELHESVKDIRVVRAFSLGALVGLLIGAFGVLICLVTDDSIYIPNTLAYRYGQPVLGCVYEDKNGLSLSLGTKENVQKVFADCKNASVTAVDEELALLPVAELLAEKPVCVPSICQVPEAIHVLRDMDGVVLLVSAGVNQDSEIIHVLEQMKLHGVALKGLMLVGASKRLLRCYGLPVKGE